jgi:hypothetical protein
MSILEVTVLKKVYDDTDTVEYIVIHLVEGVELGCNYKRFDQVLEHLAELDEPISLKIDFSVFGR